MVQGSLRPGVWQMNLKTPSNSTDYVSSGAASYIGTKKYLLDETKPGPFVPGKYRCNPVLISTHSGKCDLADVLLNYKLGTAQEQVRHTTGELMSKWVSAPIYATYWDQNLANWAIQEAYAKLNSADFDFALVCAEISETLELLRNPMKNLTDLFDKIRGGKNKRFNRHMSLADYYGNELLAFQYGIVPLLLTIQDIIDRYKNGLAKGSEALVRKKGGIKKESCTSIDTKYIYDFVEYTVRKTVSTKKIATCSVYTKVTQDVSSLDPSSWGFDIRQLPNLLWERMSYSFVLDWFANVGAWLGALTPLSRYDIQGNCVSIKTEIATEYTCIRARPTLVGAVLEGDMVGNASTLITQLERKCEQAIPALPAYNPAWFSLRHAITAAALSWQRVPRSMRIKHGTSYK